MARAVAMPPAATTGTSTAPRTPALATAAASSGVEAAPPMPACWIGTEHPTSSVNAVRSMAALCRLPGSGGAVRRGRSGAGVAAVLPQEALELGHQRLAADL